MDYSTGDEQVQLLVRRFWQMVNDSCWTSLWLQFSARKLAVAMFLLSAQYCELPIAVSKLWSYCDADESPSSDHRSDIKRIWTQLLEGYDPECRIHQYATLS